MLAPLPIISTQSYIKESDASRHLEDGLHKKYLIDPFRLSCSVRSIKGPMEADRTVGMIHQKTPSKESS